MATCFDALTSSDGDWAKPEKPKMSVSCLHVLTRNNVLMYWRANFVWWPLGKAEKTQDVSLVFTCFDALTLSDGDWAKLEKTRVSVYNVYMFWRVNFVLKASLHSQKREDVSLVLTCIKIDALTSSDCNWAKPKKPRMSVYVFKCCDT